MITEKIIQALLKPAIESIEILKLLEAKVDAQALGKLRGAFRLLQTAGAGPGSELTLQMALGAFTESAEYFRSLIEVYESELNFDHKLNRKTGVGKAMGWGKFVTGSVRDLLGLGEGELNRLVKYEAQRIDFVNLLMLSELGRIACMTEMHYNEAAVAQDLELLRTSDFGVEDDPFLDRAVQLGVLPQEISRLGHAEFERRFGGELEYDAIRPPDEHREWKNYIMQQDGRSMEEIRRNNPRGYQYVTQQAGRQPRDLDDYVDMMLANQAKNQDMVDKVLDWGEKRLLYWTDKDLMRTWAQSYFRYAALRTVVKVRRAPAQLLTALASSGLG